MNRLGVRTSTGCRSFSGADHSVPRIFDFNVPVSPLVAPTISLANASAKQLVKYQTALSVKKWQMHATDCGSTAVQSKRTMINIEVLFNICGSSCLHH